MTFMHRVGMRSNARRDFCLSRFSYSSYHRLWVAVPAALPNRS